MACVLFVCLHNAGRSQMSQALFERAADGRHTALSAGTTPAAHVHPEVIEVIFAAVAAGFHERPEYPLGRDGSVVAELEDLVVARPTIEVRNVAASVAGATAACPGGRCDACLAALPAS
jgi:hypothetical protein